MPRAAAALCAGGWLAATAADSVTWSTGPVGSCSDGAPQLPAAKCIQETINTTDYSAVICCAQSPALAGGSFDVARDYGLPILRIEAYDNRQGYCGDAATDGPAVLRVHCGCSGSCLIRAGWRLHLAPPAPAPPSPPPAPGAAPTWRTGMAGECWTDAACRRALVVSHGGDWNVAAGAPYDSLLAFERAFALGTDAVKGDLRVTKDNVAVVAHSSPFEIYESLRCVGKKVEEMTAAEVTGCDMIGTNQTFITVPDLLRAAKGRAVVMLCVKEPRDIPRAIATLAEEGAADRAFLEVHISDLLAQRASAPGWDGAYYVIDGEGQDEYTRFLAAPSDVQARSFMFEFDKGSADWGVNLTDWVRTLHGMGIRTMAVSNEDLPTAAGQEQLFNNGYDVVYTYGLGAAVKARAMVDEERGVAPP